VRPTAAGYADYAITATEDTWFAPGLGMVKAQRSIVDSQGVTLDPPHTIVFSKGTVAGLYWDFTSPPAALDGSAVDVALAHNSVVYDVVRNVYYASVPGSVIGKGNSIATIDPATGQVSYSATIGSEPNALAIAADASVLYVGLDGSGEVVRLTLPSMTEQGRVQLPVDPNLGPAHARGLAVSPSNAAIAAVSMGSTFGVALLRDMAMQPKRASIARSHGLLAFDAPARRSTVSTTRTPNSVCAASRYSPTVSPNNYSSPPRPASERGRSR
jgi:hypothetical protein